MVIPLQPEEARERSVRRLVERQFAGVDHQPQLREQLRQEVLAQAKSAAVSDARVLALSLQRVDGVRGPGLACRALDRHPGRARRCRRVTPRHAPGRVPTWTPATCRIRARPRAVAAGAVLRRVHQTEATLAGAEPLPTLVTDYWLERPDGNGLVHLAFSTPLVAFREPMLGLFDAIVGALRWVHKGDKHSP